MFLLLMDNKKDEVISILETLEKDGVWKLSKPLKKFLTQKENITNKLLESIIELINNTLENTTNSIEKQKLNKARSKLENIKKTEEKERKEEIEYADNLLDQI